MPPLTVRYPLPVTDATPTPDPVLHRWRQIAWVLVMAQATVVLVLAGYAGWQLVTGSAVVPRNEGMLAALLLVSGGGLVLVARGLRRGRRGVRMACLVFQVLVALGTVPAMWEAGRQVAAVAVALVAALTGTAAIRATTEPPTAEPSDR